MEKKEKTTTNFIIVFILKKLENFLILMQTHFIITTEMKLVILSRRCSKQKGISSRLDRR